MPRGWRQLLERRGEPGHEVHALAAIGKEQDREQHRASHAAGEQDAEDEFEGIERAAAPTREPERRPWRSLRPDARVDQPIGDIDQEIDENDEERQHRDRALQHRIVAAEMASKASVPMPGQLNTRSTMTMPPIRPPNCRPI